MKRLYLLLTALLISGASHAQNVTITTKDSAGKTSTFVAQVPEFPGGMQAFYKYLNKNLRYPDVARLLGTNGKLVMSFVVDRDGRIVDAAPKNCIGAGCEAEAARLLEASPVWKPGIKDGKPVRVTYVIPINFDIDQGKVTFRDLRASDYGFVFNIKGVLYTIDEAQKILGKFFMPDQVETTQPFFNYNNIQKFDMPNKKEVYLLIFKSEKSS